MKQRYFLLIFILFIHAVFAQDGVQSMKSSYVPADGFVPDENTAIQIARAVWIPIYGEAQIESEKPFKAILKDGVWLVTGSLQKGALGGVATAEISKSDGRILAVMHGK